MTTLRPYQIKAVDDLSASLRHHDHVLGWFPTASGKSAVIAEICRRVLAKNPVARVLALCHQAEILFQNKAWCTRLGVRSSIYCAGSGEKDGSASVVHASRDSLGRNPLACGLFDVVIVDEAHLVSANEKTRYAKIFRAISPKKIVGLTGTPWRLDNGRIFGRKKFWRVCAARVSMTDLFAQGYLTPYIIPELPPVIDTGGLRKVGGDFDPLELEARSSSEEVVRRCLDQWEAHAKGRRCTLVFCCSVKHAQMVHEQMTARGHKGRILTGETPAKERESILSRAREGAYTYVCNVAVLTTGVDLPIVDCLLFLRATESLSLFVQMCGRALRLYPDKENALMLDAAGNFARLGRPEEPIEPEDSTATKKKWTPEELISMGIDPALMKGAAPEKECPVCASTLPAAAKECPVCGHLFISHTDRIMLKDPDKLCKYEVASVALEYGVSSRGNDMTKVHYHVNDQTITEYVMHKSDNKYVQEKIDAKLHRIKRPISLIEARKENGFWRIKIVA